MKTTDDRYHEAGMPPPRAEVNLPTSKPNRAHASQLLQRTLGRHPDHPLTERAHDPATDGPATPDADPAGHGPDSVPLPDPDANTTEETS